MNAHVIDSTIPWIGANVSLCYFESVLSKTALGVLCGKPLISIDFSKS